MPKETTIGRSSARPTDRLYQRVSNKITHGLQNEVSSYAHHASAL